MVAAAVAAYAAGIFADTVFPIYLFPARSEEPYVPHLALIPFDEYEVEDAVVNIAVFLPLGVLIPLLQRRPARWKVLATAAGVSAGIELSQLAADDSFNGGYIDGDHTEDDRSDDTRRTTYALSTDTWKKSIGRTRRAARGSSRMIASRRCVAITTTATWAGRVCGARILAGVEHLLQQHTNRIR